MSASRYIYQTRGELDRAVEMYEKAPTINEALCRHERLSRAHLW